MMQFVSAWSMKNCLKQITEMHWLQFYFAKENTRPNVPFLCCHQRQRNWFKQQGSGVCQWPFSSYSNAQGMWIQMEEWKCKNVFVHMFTIPSSTTVSICSTAIGNAGLVISMHCFLNILLSYNLNILIYQEIKTVVPSIWILLREYIWKEGYSV